MSLTSWMDANLRTQGYSLGEEQSRDKHAEPAAPPPRVSVTLELIDRDRGRRATMPA
ncbi:MAG TPA: hypothetical protein VF549_16630 [Solirubrobacteraceae bacterium]|jgi:hypothetical protein